MVSIYYLYLYLYYISTLLFLCFPLFIPFIRHIVFIWGNKIIVLFDNYVNRIYLFFKGRNICSTNVEKKG